MSYKLYRNQNIPVLIDVGEKAVTGEEKAELLAFTFQKAHSTDNLEEDYKRREEILKQHKDINAKKTNSLKALDATLKMWEKSEEPVIHLFKVYMWLL